MLIQSKFHERYTHKANEVVVMMMHDDGMKLNLKEVFTGRIHNRQQQHS